MMVKEATEQGREGGGEILLVVDVQHKLQLCTSFEICWWRQTGQGEDDSPGLAVALHCSELTSPKLIVSECYHIMEFVH